MNTLFWQWLCLVVALPWVLDGRARPAHGWVALVAIGLQQAIRLLDPDERRRRFDLDVTWPIIGLVVASIVGVAVSPIGEFSFGYLSIRLFTFALFTILVGSLRRRTGPARWRGLWWALTAFVLAGVFIAVTLFLIGAPRMVEPGLIQAVTDARPPVPPVLRERLGLRFVHPNIVAGMLVPFLPIGAALVLFRPWRGREALIAPGATRRLGRARVRAGFDLGAGLALVVIGLVLAWTVSRAGYGAAAVGCGFVAASRWPATRRPLVLALGLLALAGLALLLAGLSGRWPGWLGPVVERIDVLLDLERIEPASDTFGWRLKLWDYALALIRAHPWTGVGLMAAYLYVGSSAGQAHNLFLQMALDTGLPGVAFLIALLVIAAVRLRRALCILRGSPHESFALGLAGAVIAFLTWSMVDWPGFGKGAAVYWVLFGLVLSLPVSAERRRCAPQG